ncbi:MAG: hypothetical protein ABGX00_07940 [Allomuricauda sp.]
MNERFKNLAAALAIFTEELDLSSDQTIGILNSDIEQGYIDKSKLNEELKLALNDPNFMWLDFAIETKLLVYDLEKYTNDKVKEYCKSLLRDYLYSESE